MLHSSGVMCPDQGQQPVSEEKKLLDFSLDILCSINAEGRFTYINGAVKKLLGYEPAELIGKPYLDLVVPEDKAKTACTAEALKQGSVITAFENTYQRKDGTVVPLHWSAHWDANSQTLYGVAKDATVLHLSEENARLNEQRLLKAYKLGRIGWWEWHAANDTNHVSDELYEIYGLSRAHFPTISTALYRSLVHPDDIPIVQEAYSSIRHQQYLEYEHRMIKPCGQIIFVIHYIEAEQNKKGDLLKVYGITKDITLRKTAELSLKASEQKLTTILESIGDCFFAVDRSWTVTYWNQMAEKTLRKKKEEIVGRNLWEEYTAAMPLKFYEEYHRAMQESISVHFEEYFAPLQMWFEASAYPSAEGLSVYFRDITEKKKVTEALQESNQRYELVSKATSDAIWDWNPQTDTFYWSEGFRITYGHHLQTFPTDLSFWRSFIHPADADRVVSNFEKAIKGRETLWTDEYRFLKADGTFAFVADRAVIIRNENGDVQRVVGAMQDVTLQKEAELSLRLSEEKFRLLFYESPWPKWMFSEDSFQIVEANNAALKLYGYSKEEFLNLSIPDLKLTADLSELYVLREKGVNRYQNIVQHRKKNGEVFPIELSTHLIDLPAGRHFIVTGEDVTEKLQLQQLVMEEKISAQKEIAKAIIATQERERSEIAKELHDNVNQLLTTAKLYIENLSYFPDRQETFIKKSVNLLQDSINEIRVLSRQLVTPAIQDTGFRSILDELFGHFLSLNLFDIRLNYGIAEEDLDKGLQVTIYRIVQEQLNNIVKHANASKVVVEIGYDADKLKISICDNGVGFEREKAGKGLGLNNMKNRVEVYKGTFEIVSAVGKGTTITVRFPHRLINPA